MQRTRSHLFLFGFVLVGAALGQSAPTQQSCKNLKNLIISPHVEITSATPAPEGLLEGTGRPAFGTTRNPATMFAGVPPLVVPARCVVKVVSRPTSDSNIGVEVWLPFSGWNGNYQQVGNGGLAGSIPKMYMAQAILRGYATAGTDDGHSTQGGGFAIGHPEKVIDYGYRALHQTKFVAAVIIQRFYGRGSKWNYFVGASDGGREALMVAQRYPEDFDGILAGATAAYETLVAAGRVWDEQALAADSGAATIPAMKLAIIQNAALNACDALDGLNDGLIENPAACHFDPRVLTCKGMDGPDCLTVPEVTALEKIYTGPKNPRTKKQIFSGFAPGTENTPYGWSVFITGTRNPLGNYLSQIVFEQSDSSCRRLNFDSDIALAEQKTGAIIDATNPDLRTFRDHGGKLVQYHGWGDPIISPYSAITYYNSVEHFLATYPDPRSHAPKSTRDFYRLFMVPGMGHGGYGIGTNLFGQAGWGNKSKDPKRNIMAALERWVEDGVPPDEIIAAGKEPKDPTKDMTRPLCVYPLVARYKGTGNPYDAANFRCGPWLASTMGSP